MLARHKFGSGTLLKPRERDLLLKAAALKGCQGRNTPEQVKSHLRQTARYYTSDETDLVHNIERALQSLSEQPSLLDGPYIDETPFRIVHENARSRTRVGFVRRLSGYTVCY